MTLRATAALTVVLIFLAAPLHAATLEQIVTPFALPATSLDDGPSWESAAKAAGIRWKQAEPRRYGAGRSSRGGTTRLQGHGTAWVYLSGSEDFVSEIDVSVSEKEGKIFEQEEFSKVLRSQFRRGTPIRLLSKCSFGSIAGMAVYEVVLKGRKPIYIAVMTDSGGKMPNTRSSSFQVSQRVEERWTCGG